MQGLERQGRVHEVKDQAERIAAIAKEYARVKSVDAAANQITVVRLDGSEVAYDPRRQQGVSLYRDQEKASLGR